MAGNVVATAPLILVFLFAQRQFCRPVIMSRPQGLSPQPVAARTTPIASPPLHLQSERDLAVIPRSPSSARAASSSPGSCCRPARLPRAARTARIVLHDIDPERLETADGARPAQPPSTLGAAPTVDRRAATARAALDGADFVINIDPGRRARGDRHRLRDPGALRAAPDHRRHPRRRRDLPRRCAPSRCSTALAARHAPRCARTPGCSTTPTRWR